jgi:hypothetical protein
MSLLLFDCIHFPLRNMGGKTGYFSGFLDFADHPLATLLGLFVPSDFDLPDRSLQRRSGYEEKKS